MKKFVSIILIVVISMQMVACGKKDGEKNNDVTPASKSEVKEKEDKDDGLSLIFGGDVLFSQSMINTYNRDGGNVENIMAKNLLEEFQKADIAMFNQEFPFSLRGTKMQDKQFTFRADPRYVDVITETGTDIVSLANNHVLDYGIDALVDTLDVLNEASIVYGGAGNNLDEAKEIKYITAEDKKVAFICATRVIPVTDWNATDSRPGMLTTYDPTIVLEQLKEAENNADYSVVYVHWGVEHQEYPEEYQKTMAKQYIDEGADMVIGCHTHCLQGIEIYNGKPIVYSLGNFMFGGNIDRTMAVKMNIENDNIGVQLLPCEAKSYCTSIIEDTDKRNSFYEYYKGISFNVDIDSEGNVRSN